MIPRSLCSKLKKEQKEIYDRRYFGKSNQADDKRKRKT
jgi:hypothetical protein